jgi:non-heme chloroperoxidase
MARIILGLVAVLAAVLVNAAASKPKDIAGTWQGTLKVGAQELRIVIQVAKGGDGWKGTMYSIDQSPNGVPVTEVTLDESILKLRIDPYRISFEGTMSDDGSSVSGTWKQTIPLPLELRRAAKEAAWTLDSSPHRVQFVTVDKDVKLEILDWGGTGRPLVLLTGLGDNAHVFDKFAAKLISTYRVYGITRRGFGASSVPASGYSADRLGDDVLAVLAALKVEKPVLIGHSIAGEELSSIGSRHPEKVAGLVYLDAGYAYAYYDDTRGNLQMDLPDLQKKLAQLQLAKQPANVDEVIAELLESTLPKLTKNLEELRTDIKLTPATVRAQQAAAVAVSSPALSIIEGEQKYQKIPAPILSIFAIPRQPRPLMAGSDPAMHAESQVRDNAKAEAQATAFEKGLPSARVVRIKNASHYVFLSNEADVLREINSFVAGLK